MLSFNYFALLIILLLCYLITGGRLGGADGAPHVRLYDPITMPLWPYHHAPMTLSPCPYHPITMPLWPYHHAPMTLSPCPYGPITMPL